MGNSPKNESSQQDSSIKRKPMFDNDHLYKVQLKGHMSKIAGISMVELKDPNQILISTVGKDGYIMIWLIKEKKILNYSLKKKMKIEKTKQYLHMAIPTGTSYNLVIGAITFNNELNSILVAWGGLNNCCTIHKINIKTASSSLLNDIHITDGYVSCISFLNDNTNRVIIGSGDATVKFYNYVDNKLLLTVNGKEDVCGMDYFHKKNENSNILILTFGCVGGNIFVANIDDHDHDNMKIIHIQTIQCNEFKVDINCIKFSTNNRHIACGDESGYVMILNRRNVKDSIEYDIIYQKDLKPTTIKTEQTPSDDWNPIYSICWVDANTFAVGLDNVPNKISMIKINYMSENSEYVKCVEPKVGIALAQLILEFCGFYVNDWYIDTAFNNQRVTSMTSLPNCSISPGIFAASSWDSTSIVYIPSDCV
eukprot:218863_1